MGIKTDREPLDTSVEACSQRQKHLLRIGWSAVSKDVYTSTVEGVHNLMHQLPKRTISQEACFCPIEPDLQYETRLAFATVRKKEHLEGFFLALA